MDSLRSQLKKEINKALGELSYQGNMGVQEIFQFFDKATKKEIDLYHRLIKQNKIKASWQLIQMVLDVKLKGKEFEATVMQTTKAAGKTQAGKDKMKPKPHWEVSPPGFGHTKADKKKGIKKGGTAAAMKRAQDRGDIPKDMNIFALMWSMKNKGDKPHYKPGTNKKYKKYQKEE